MTPEETDERVAALRSSELFAGCSPTELRAVAAACHREEHPRGTELFREGDPGDSCYFVVVGRVVVRSGGRALGVVGPGEALGEMALVEAAPRAATAAVVDDLTCLCVSTTDFGALLENSPSVAKALLVTLSRRLRAVQDPGPSWG